MFYIAFNNVSNIYLALIVFMSTEINETQMHWVAYKWINSLFK